MPSSYMRSRQSLLSRHAALVVCLAGIGSAASASDPAQPTLDRMDQAAANLKGLSADVAKVSHNAVLNDDDLFKGTMAVRRGPRPRDLRAVVDITWPDPKKVRLTDHKLEMYYPKTNTVQVIDLDKKGSAMVDQFLLLGFGSTSAEIRKAYKVDLGGPETVAGQKAVRLVLTPKSSDVLAKLAKVELWISETLNVAVQQKFWEPGGDYELATYTNVKLSAVPEELKWISRKDVKTEKLN